jgi:hypothetical protein
VEHEHGNRSDSPPPYPRNTLSKCHPNCSRSGCSATFDGSAI